MQITYGDIAKQTERQTVRQDPSQDSSIYFEKYQNKRQRETEDTGWISAARSGSKWQPD